MAKKQIVILGAGFAGLDLAKRMKDTGYEITLIDQYNFHQFQPLFYQVATARLEPSSISFPLRKVFQKKKCVHVRLARVSEIDVAAKTVRTSEGDFAYDYLVIATGCTTNYFGNRNIEQYAFPMKSTTEAITLRNRILLNFEDALSATVEELPAIMNIVVVGGGPTGVELSGSLAELKKYVLPKDYPDMDFSRLNIYLLEAGPVTLAPMSKASQQKSQEYLEKMGVQVWTNALVEDYDGKTVKLKDGRTIPTHTLIWAAGVSGNLPAGIPKEQVVRGNRIRVDRYNRLEGHEDILAIGDIAYMETPEFPKGHAQLANVANAQAKNTAGNFERLRRNKPLKPFEYKNPGTMATVGKRKAVVDLPFMSFQGRIAWFVWMFLHLMLILNVKNKLIIFINWAISYFTNDTTLRLILLPSGREVKSGERKNETASPG
ncbi:NAD(P)/FAD-dependent oxidoreductase [Sediminibacterium soli]|uniref:NAD(P)/FAD-dependent oxidoreductase n=1 Tax=Sediminibacterium soli TaxID=2698829 RepID=UPI00137B25A7|nr:NAD(P)/FAD-dependent oxidoreductase [Sediminibacterium soli]NCI46257.1 NAD(P)/FAD-dependent oxidoreductase [Sediminibacterium soli]